jgi:hypothetical protein
MSLHALATDMASKGRNGDSMLVHMTPGEVHGLQALAIKHGGSLTINPDTGLPEANFLKSLLPMLAGFALGPAGFGLVSSAMGAGALVGGITGIATGSLSKGLMAGLGAYGGFGVGEGLMGAGTSTIGAAEAAKGVTMTPELAADLNIGGAGEGVKDRLLQQQVTDKIAAATPYDKLSSGLDAFKNNPMGMTKSLAMPLGMAAAPIMADMMVPTTTKASTPVAPGRIREKRWDGRQFVDVANTDAGVYNTSGRSFSDLYRGYNNGGIVALAGGGDVKHFAIGDVVKADIDKAYAAGDYGRVNELAQANKITAEDVASTYKGFDTSGLADKGINLFTPPPVDYNKVATDYVTTAAATPNITTSDFITGANTAGIGLTAPLASALQNSGLSAAAQYALTHADIGSPQNTAETYGGLAGLSNNINYALSQNKLTGAAGMRAALDEMDKYGINEDDIFRATGKKLTDLFPQEIKTITQIITNQGGGTGNDILKGTTIVPGVNDYGLGGTGTSGALESVYGPALPPGVSGAGTTIVNPNGTITTRPDLSLGMKTVRDDYVRGGGSLGYTSPVPTSLDAFNKTYVTDRMSGDSLAALNYLTGKAGATYPTKSNFAGQLSQDYATAVLGYPARGNLPYIYNKATGKMDPNPDYVAPGRNAAGNVTYSMSLNDIKKSLTDTPLSGQALYDWAMSNNLSAQQIADATGRSLSSVYADFRAGSKAKTDADKKAADDKTAADAANNKLDDSSTGGEAAGGLQQAYAMGGATGYALGGLGTLGGYSDGGRLLKGPGDGVSDSIPATIGRKQQPARLADGEFVVPARIVSELGNGSTDAGAKKLYAMMDRVQRARGKTTGKNKVAANSRADKYLPA